MVDTGPVPYLADTNICTGSSGSNKAERNAPYNRDDSDRNRAVFYHPNVNLVAHKQSDAERSGEKSQSQKCTGY